MTISAKLLNGNIINRDADFSKYIETVSEAGVIEGFQVSANAVAKGKARVPCERSNGEKLFVLVLNDNNIPIDGNGDVYINIAQSHIDNGELSSDDGTGIATIEVGTMPSKNALKLAVKNGSTITDERNMLKKISDLEGLIDSIEERTATLEEEIGEILDKGAIDHLEESGLVGEKYTLSDTLFMQQSPLSSNCTLEANVGDVDANKQIHIQRMGSGTESNQIQLKLKKVGEPTQNLIVEIRRGVKVDVSSNEAYWYGNEVITSSSIAYGNITTDFAEYTVTFPESFGANQGDLLDIVLYQNGKIVNDINYYVIACDSTQYSEAYSFVAINGETKVRSKLMPYCSSVGFAQSLLCKVNSLQSMDGVLLTTGTETEWSQGYNGETHPDISYYSFRNIFCPAGNITATFTLDKMIKGWSTSSSLSSRANVDLIVNGVSVANMNFSISSNYSGEKTLTYNLTEPGFVSLKISGGQYNTNTYQRGMKILTSSLINRDYLNNTIKVLPRLLNNIGEITTTTLYGKNIDDMYIGGIIIGKTTEAVVGGITLGNAVGYLVVNYNGNALKIPYYL